MEGDEGSVGMAVLFAFVFMFVGVCIGMVAGPYIDSFVECLHR
jgi:ABC-type dipeptide/oligopeptide/nickel transport system permease subunit